MMSNIGEYYKFIFDIFYFLQNNDIYGFAARR